MSAPPKRSLSSENCLPRLKFPNFAVPRVTSPDSTLRSRRMKNGAWRLWFSGTCETGSSWNSTLREVDVTFPYIPGLLSFREAPALLATLKKIKTQPDVLICDGQGLAHPRRFGIACHVGLLTGLPSIGCAKSILVGEHDELNSARGSKVSLEDHGERIGTVLRTRDGVNPVYVSVGHRIDLPRRRRNRPSVRYPLSFTGTCAVGGPIVEGRKEIITACACSRPR